MVPRLAHIVRKGWQLSVPTLFAVALFLLTFTFLADAKPGLADPIDPPEGYPKLSQSLKTVTPTLAGTGGETLYYRIEVRNTGAYMAENVSVVDPIPAHTSYNGDGEASSGAPPTLVGNALEWNGDVGFDDTVVISFSVDVGTSYVGIIANSAVISQAVIPEPVTVTAEARITDTPVLSITKTSAPLKPGALQPLTYTLVVENMGQPALALPVTVYDEVPAHTDLRSVGPDGTPGPGKNSVTWTRVVSLDVGQTSTFTFSVDVKNVISGTVISNDTYTVDSDKTDLVPGEVVTTTVVDPILSLTKEAWPDPPGANREMTYTLTLFNQGSRATGIVVTDVVPAGVTYVRGGDYDAGVVSWAWPALDTNESATFTYTVWIGDVAGFAIVNDDYAACTAQSVCVPGEVVSHTIGGPTFEVKAWLDPIAKKPGGGGGPVTPTVTVENLGPGNALAASALLYFGRISVSENDLEIIPPEGSFDVGPPCEDHCTNYTWSGDIAAGEIFTFTTTEPQSTIGGAEGTNYTLTLTISDTLGVYTTEPVSDTAVGHVTHLANLIPTKRAPAVIGRGQLMTYTFSVWNSALTTDVPPAPTLTDTVPPSTTLVSVNGGGSAVTVAGNTAVSWTLPSMGPGEYQRRSYVVRVDGDLVSGTQIINDDYWTRWYELEDGEVLSHTGKPVTTTVREVGLIDSFKAVTPTWALPADDNLLTFTLHIANTSPNDLADVEVYDLMPWEHSTYQRDAVISGGQVISDIVSISWNGDVPAYSERVMTMTALVDPFYEGAITNTAVLSHPSLLEPVVVHAVAYITDDPVLQISKEASPDPVPSETELTYQIHVKNLGNLATSLVVTDVVPTGTVYVPGSASGNGQLDAGEVRWQTPLLAPGESRTYTFRVLVGIQDAVFNQAYGVRAAEGVVALGDPVITPVDIRQWNVYLPEVRKE